MSKLTQHEIVIMFLALGTLLAMARVFGEAARYFKQPAVLGEIVAGIMLGPAFLGRLMPEVQTFLFPRQGPNALALDALTLVAVVMFLLVAGMEVDLSRAWRQGRTAIVISLAGMAFPFGVGLVTASLAPGLLGREPGADPTIFTIFFATALAISALPVIAKTLMDLDIYRSDVGITIVSAAIIDDLAGWIIFGMLLGMMGAAGAGHGFSPEWTVALTLAFAVVVLTVGRWLINRAIPWLQAYVSWPGGVLGFALSLAFFGAAVTDWIGIHAIFGSYLIGIAVGDSPHLREETRSTIERFISFIFAPLFFASIGLKVDIAANFDWIVVSTVLVVACIGKLVGCTLGARLVGVDWREALGIGFGLNARGAMEIILGLLALQAGIIGERLFVALVIMALVTSVISGPMMKYLFGLQKPVRFTHFITARAFVARMQARSRREAIRELAEAVAAATGVDVEVIAGAALAQEERAPSGLVNGLAVPHARLSALTSPVVGVGISRFGVDFDAPDGRLSRLIFLVLTPSTDDGAEQSSIFADIAMNFRDTSLREQALRVETYTQFRALVRYAEESFSDVGLDGGIPAHVARE
jgi:Kef-type K+ transport system membrane component KefB/mannitol/fructose-specific phosphotransferase system IIA component (Ntr-type)